MPSVPPPRAKARKLSPPLAVALAYEPQRGQAPIVVATGRGLVAEQIMRLADEHGVPIHQDPHLAEMLGDVEVQEAIPEELFEAVARVLAFVWRVDRRVQQALSASR
jgi:flagellar biosynthesis protein